MSEKQVKQVKQVKLYCTVCGKIEAWVDACTETGHCIGKKEVKSDNIFKGGKSNVLHRKK